METFSRFAEFLFKPEVTTVIGALLVSVAGPLLLKWKAEKRTRAGLARDIAGLALLWVEKHVVAKKGSDAKMDAWKEKFSETWRDVTGGDDPGSLDIANAISVLRDEVSRMKKNK